LTKSGHIDASLVSTDARKFNVAMSKSPLYGESMTRFDGTNPTGVFRVKYARQYFYYFTEKQRQVEYPTPLNNTWKDRVLQAAVNVLVIPSTRARPAINSAIFHDDSNFTEGDESPNKRPRIEESTPQQSSILSYWPDSPEARQVFRPRTTRMMRTAVSTSSDEDGNTTTLLRGESAKLAVERRIKLLQTVHEKEDSWRNIVMGRDEENFCTKAEIFEIRQRAIFLCCAYQLALTKMNDWTWHDCCKEACNRLNSLGLVQATFFKTIANWNKVFRKFECFPHPNPYVQCGKRPMPRLLEVFPNAKDQIIAFGIKNLATLTIESVHDFILSTVLPTLTVLWEKEMMIPDRDITPEAGSQAICSFLKVHRLESMSLTTTWRWMRLLGFQYDTRKKSFYVDGHERDDVVASRSTFCKRYLTEYEPYCNRWIQLSTREAKTIKNLNVEFGYSYIDIRTNEEWIEFHVDYWSRIMEEGTKQQPVTIDVIQHKGKTATTSIRVSTATRPIMIVGQDESVFAQYLLGSKTWVGPKGQRPLLPKSEGDGYMLSAFVSREFGFGRELSADELVKINTARRGGDRTYIDTQAALEILKSTQKPALKESPFVKYLYIGANNEGYWNSYHMSLQFEDVVDCLQVLYPEFDVVFLFDHSQGHARKRPGALNAFQMSKTYGGAQAVMRDTTIMSKEGYLGAHLPRLNVGDTQSFIFNSDDCGPFYLSPEQREQQRRDRPTGKIKRVERSKKMLMNALSNAGVSFQQQRSYTKKELQEFARIRGIDLFEEKEQIIVGWQGQPKGLLQVLWERGLILEHSLEKYTLDGRKDAITGIVDLHYSLRNLLAECTDFKEEETALQYLGTQLGVTVQLTPKFHAELAGEGVEYSWAHAKAYYRRVPVSRKRGRENFKDLVKECTSPVKVLTKDRIEKFASRARAYICTYHHLEQVQSGPAAAATGVDPTADLPKQELLYTEIERLMKAFKGHRCALDFDRGFVNSELKEEATREVHQDDDDEVY
jgi:hypothetical protein